MKRSKKIIVISHCVINQNAVVYDLARAPGAFPIASKLLETGWGVIQLGCPELMFAGCERDKNTYNGYNSEPFRAVCRDIIQPVLTQIDNYLAHGYELVGVLGIRKSPSCSISGQRGVFMEEFFNTLELKGITPKFFEIPEDYTGEESAETDALFSQLLAAFEDHS